MFEIIECDLDGLVDALRLQHRLFPAESPRRL
jgi:hypothetical protein